MGIHRPPGERPPPGSSRCSDRAAGCAGSYRPRLRPAAGVCPGKVGYAQLLTNGTATVGVMAAYLLKGGRSGSSHGIGERVGRAPGPRQAGSFQASLEEPCTWM